MNVLMVVGSYLPVLAKARRVSLARVLASGPSRRRAICLPSGRFNQKPLPRQAERLNNARVPVGARHIPVRIPARARSELVQRNESDRRRVTAGGTGELDTDQEKKTYIEMYKSS